MARVKRVGKYLLSIVLILLLIDLRVVHGVLTEIEANARRAECL